MLYGINIVMRLPMRAKFLNVASDNFKLSREEYFPLLYEKW
jgi:hypothetical protein